MLAEANAVQSLSSKPRAMNFINSKVFESEQFGGMAEESYKAWSKKINISLNSQRRGLTGPKAGRRVGHRSRSTTTKSWTGRQRWKSTKHCMNV